jgi:nucleoporin POM152
VISPELISPAQQRLGVVLLYIGLLIWRFRDFWILVEDETESLWQFLKWVFIDAAFIYGVPAMRVPWLEWSSTTTTVLFSVHALLNGMLMFRILVSSPQLFVD